MDRSDTIRAFMARSTMVEAEIRALEDQLNIKLLTEAPVSGGGREDVREKFYLQFDASTRAVAAEMAVHYEMFYGFENSVRELVQDAMFETYGDTWWDMVPGAVKENVQRVIDREKDNAISTRSENPIDYTTFGELSTIIGSQFSNCFGDIFNSRKGVTSVLARLNVLRGPIAHCSPLAEDEVVRLNLSIRDWFRLME